MGATSSALVIMVESHPGQSAPEITMNAFIGRIVAFVMFKNNHDKSPLWTIKSTGVINTTVNARCESRPGKSPRVIADRYFTSKIKSSNSERETAPRIKLNDRDQDC